MRNGWLHGGDVGVFDEEGYLNMVDRIKDIVITGGENVFLKEAEDLLHQHLAVNECGVVGLPHEEYGEAVTAFVTIKPGMHVDEKPRSPSARNAWPPARCRNPSFCRRSAENPTGQITAARAQEMLTTSL